MADRSGRGPRSIRPDELALWDKVAATADPMHARREAEAMQEAMAGAVTDSVPGPLRRTATALPAGMTKLRPRPKWAAPTTPASGFDLAEPEVLPVGRPQAGLDRRTSEKLRRGVRTPDARIDLHGMSAERAHRACLVFLADAAARGCRMVLVITGKGGHERGGVMRDGRGVLRASLPGWLRSSHLRHTIVGIYQAHRKHGGEGAMYVYLKRQR